jgi:hypothetical protein
MIIQIKCKNDKLMDVLYKNPSTDLGLYAKPLKKGIVIGQVINAHQYDVVFQDTKYSYLPEDSNSIDFQSYCNPLVVVHICNELFNHVLKQREDYSNTNIDWLGITQGQADTEACVITIPTFYINSSWYRNDAFLLSRYFEGVQVKHLVGKNFELTITAASIFESINLLALVSVFTHITNEYGINTYIDDSLATKYARVLTNLNNVPYFVFYLFTKRTVKNDEQFKLVKPMFEEYLAKQGLEVNLTKWSTHQARVRFISSLLDTSTDILDIGCGEFIYYKRMMNLGFKGNYFAIDTDNGFEALANTISKRYEEGNLFFYDDLEKCETTTLVNMVMTEVIEHNALPDAKLLVEKALTFNFNQIIITTPNVSFNKYYSAELDTRHDDHHFELTEEEFKQFIESCIVEKAMLNIEYTYIGDTINNTQPTQVAIIKKK